MSKQETRQYYSYHWEARYKIRETNAGLINSSPCLSSLSFSLQRTPWSLSEVSSVPCVQAQHQAQGTALLTSLAIVLPWPPTPCTSVILAGLQSPLSLQPGKLDDIEFPRYKQPGVKPGQVAIYVRPDLKPWLLSHLSHFLLPAFCFLASVVEEMHFHPCDSACYRVS